MKLCKRRNGGEISAIMEMGENERCTHWNVDDWAVLKRGVPHPLQFSLAVRRVKVSQGKGRRNRRELTLERAGQLNQCQSRLRFAVQEYRLARKDNKQVRNASSRSFISRIIITYWKVHRSRLKSAKSDNQNMASQNNPALSTPATHQHRSDPVNYSPHCSASSSTTGYQKAR